MDKLTNFIERLIDIVGHKGDREKFLKNFLSGIYLRAFNNLFESLSLEDQKEAKQLIKSSSDKEDLLGRFLKDKLGSSKVDEALKDSTQEILIEYFKEISPSLSSKKKTELQEYMTSLEL